MPDARLGDEDQPASPAWRPRMLRLALAALPLWFTASLLISGVVWPIKLIVGIALGVTLANPAHGLLLAAVLAPLGELIGPLVGATSFRSSEAIVVAFLVGWLLRGLPDRRGPGVAAPAVGWLFAAAIVASIAGVAWRLGRYPIELDATVDQIAHVYFSIADRIGLVDGARLLEGMALAVATVGLFRRSPSLAVTLPIALTASAAAAALSSVLLWRGIGFAAALARYRSIGYRLSAHVADVNAAGTHFAMIVCLALGMAARARGYRRAIWLALAGASGIGLWLSESRSALGAAGMVVIVAALWTATARFSARARTATMVVVVVGLIAGAAVRARLLQTDPDYRGVGFREQFTQASLRVIAARPLFGVGEGQYYVESPAFLSPQLAWTYGAENAHNFFLQVAGELGLAGFGLFILWLGAAIARAARAVARTPGDARLMGAGGGVAVFLITCLTGHPFLVSEVAYPFWILFGLMTALAGSALLNARAAAGGSRAGAAAPRAWQLPTAAAAIVILCAGSIATARGRLAPIESQAVDGFYGWETLEDGTRFRWTGAYASLFVPQDVMRVDIPVRLPADGRLIKPMGVEVTIAGIDQGRTLVDAPWTVLSFRLPNTPPSTPFNRIDLKLDRVWQPAVYIAGSPDMRRVGVQVGEVRMLRR